MLVVSVMSFGMADRPQGHTLVILHNLIRERVVFKIEA